MNILYFKNKNEIYEYITKDKESFLQYVITDQKIICGNEESKWYFFIKQTKKNCKKCNKYALCQNIITKAKMYLIHLPCDSLGI